MNRAALVGLLLFPACGEPAPRLAERPSFHGRIAVTSATGTTFEGELAFDRANGNLQFTVRGSEQTVATARRPGGGIAVFRDGVPGEATAAETERFALVERLVDRKVPASEGVSVRIIEVFDGGAHGWR